MTRSYHKSLVSLLLTCSAHAATLDLSSVAINASGSATFSLYLTPDAIQPAGLQWTLSYNPAQVTSASVAASASATASGKTLACSPDSTVCVLSGSAATIGSGAVATITLTATPSAIIQLSGLIAVDAGGNALPITSRMVGGIINGAATPDGPNLWHLGHVFTSKPVCFRNGVSVPWAAYSRVGGDAIFPHIGWSPTDVVLCSEAFESP